MNVLQKWLSDNGMNDQTAAERLGVSRVHALRYRLGQCRPSRETAKRLEPITGISWVDLYAGKDA